MEKITEKIIATFDYLRKMIELHVVHRFEHMRFNDFLDIVLLTFLFYYVIKFFWDKRGAKLFKGIITVLLAMIIVNIFNMKAMSFIFSSFYQVGIIALIIMFQPELRLALENLGNTPFTSIKHIASDIKSSEYVSNSITTITEISCGLSMERTGALIVIEKDTKLGEHMRTGTIINGQLSSQLLKNIFYNKAPLHDGAVIIRDYKVFSAGCFLPLSMKDDIDEDLGTRHRAAIGISEVSDAVVIVVSEETGVISIAHKGKLTRNYNFQTLKKELTNLLIPTDPIKTSNISSKIKIIRSNKED
ncbi:MAG: diadenylate cyclase CdaA [Clostridia bacterium]|nr:diadenylate cyclase CdaA [Clostridia bacterium]